jgi:hypothetical protein
MKILIVAFAGFALLVLAACTDQSTSPTDGLDLTRTDGTIQPTGDPTQVIEAFAAAFCAGDEAAMLAALDESFSYSVCEACSSSDACAASYPWDRAEVLASLAAMFAEWKEMHWLSCHFLEADPGVNGEWVVHSGLEFGFSREFGHRVIAFGTVADVVVQEGRDGEHRIVGIRERQGVVACFSTWLCGYKAEGGVSN